MIEKNLQKVFEIIKNGNNLGEEITLVGATKTMTVDTINRAISAGLKVVAENRVQEFREKHAYISPDAKQHFIGHLQTNKVKYLVGQVELIHSVDSLHLAQEIDRVAVNKGVIQDVLVEVNVGGELSKSGFSLENVLSAVKDLSNLKNVHVKGLMAMMPLSADEDLIIDLCRKMRIKYDLLKSQGYDMTYLSMGMSNDYQLAIKNGSNLIRLGRTIFGERV